MLVESDEEMSELEVESKTFQKLVAKMKKLGFQEGVAHGRSFAMQKGFDLGYSTGFQMGLQLGMDQAKARFDANCHSDFVKNTAEHDSYLNAIPNVNCELCVNEENEQFKYDFINKTFEEMALEEEENKNKLFHLLKNVNL